MGQLRRLGPWPLYTASAPASGRGAIGVCPTVWAYTGRLMMMCLPRPAALAVGGCQCSLVIYFDASRATSIAKEPHTRQPCRCPCLPLSEDELVDGARGGPASRRHLAMSAAREQREGILAARLRAILTLAVLSHARAYAAVPTQPAGLLLSPVIEFEFSSLAKLSQGCPAQL